MGKVLRQNIYMSTQQFAGMEELIDKIKDVLGMEDEQHDHEDHQHEDEPEGHEEHEEHGEDEGHEEHQEEEE